MKVCITGGTGTLGQALTRRWLSAGVSRVVVLSRDEQKQAAMAESLPHAEGLRFFLGDVRDRDRLVDAFYDCDTVVHAAALKRVDSVAYNPSEVRRTNVEGSANVLSAALEARVSRVLMVSSDKACEPTNVYGASKSMMEHEAVAYNAISMPRGMRVSCTRYGNVLGSRGSVVHIWRKCAAEGRPLPLTSTLMTRFWLTIDDAVSIVVNALGAMEGGEVFAPTLPSLAMVDLANAIAPSYDLKVTGLRPGGEKLHETLVTAEEGQRIRMVKPGLWAILPHLHSWRSRDWSWPQASVQAPYTSEIAPRLSIEEMRRMLKDLP